MLNSHNMQCELPRKKINAPSVISLFGVCRVCAFVFSLCLFAVVGRRDLKGKLISINATYNANKRKINNRMRDATY